MVCPRCNARWDQDKQACIRCGLTLRTRRYTPSPVAPSFSSPEARRATPVVFPASHASTQPEHLSHKHKTPILPSFWPATKQPPIEQAAARGVITIFPTNPASEAPEPQTHPVDKSMSSSTPFANPTPKRDELPPRSESATASPGQFRTARANTQPPLKHENATSNLASSARKRPTARVNEVHTKDLTPLKLGTLLLNGRYRLSEQQSQQVWLAGAYESFWLAQDARRGAALVKICEFVVPDRDSLARYSLVRSATMALHAVSRHAHVPTLLDVFQEQDRSFFVFEHIEGESLLTRMRRLGHFLAEQEVLECGLQMVEVLDFMARQTPPLIHGLIRPEHIIVGRTRSHYMLTNFSVMLASGATQWTSGMSRALLSPYTPPEFAHGVIDIRSDLYSLLATAYHLLTGSLPSRSNGSLQQARRFNAHISPQFEAVLTRGLYSGQGLRPDLSKRYQHPTDLRQGLLMRTSVSGTLGSLNAVPGVAVAHRPLTPAQDPVAAQAEQMATLRDHPVLKSLATEVEREEPTLLPKPEDLPPMPLFNEAQATLYWLAGLCSLLLLTVAATRGWM